MCLSKQKLSIMTNIVKPLQQNLMKEVPKHHAHTIIPMVSTMSLNFLENFVNFSKLTIRTMILCLWHWDSWKTESIKITLPGCQPFTEEDIQIVQQLAA